MELIHVHGNSYYADGVLSVGVYLHPHKKTAIIIDSTNDKDGIKKVDKAVSQLGYQINTIINTHGHADHIGGNDYLQRKYDDLRIYATAFEKSFIEQPYLEPLMFTSGAAPYAQLKTKQLQAKPSIVTDVIPFEDHIRLIDGVPFHIVTTPGHSNAMINVMSPDGVMYGADALFGPAIVDKIGLLLFTDIEKTIQTLHKLKSLHESETMTAYVLYHGGVTEHMSDLIQQHIQGIQDAIAYFKNEIQIAGAIPFHQLLQQCMTHYKIPDHVAPYTFTHTVVHAYVSYLQQQAFVNLHVQNGTLILSHLE
ncbi:MBL fold metallo-hydrolase [Longirhabdus pacifica]|uniref:MBL fold metallo-hydrolase n=1 Tax=Longirhabdus pacifica TaxID=2305227 RepID=UPI0013E8EBFE|nr:MBL fold metallo-hydrolase [Longirhabdus pacifica]